MSVDTYSACLSLYKKIRATLKILSVFLCVQIYVVYISFLLFTTVQKKKNLKAVLFKRRETSSNPSFFSMFIHNYQRAAAVSGMCFLPISYGD